MMTTPMRTHAESDTVDVVVIGLGVPLKRQGKHWIGRCPFHDDRNPSLAVYPDGHHYHCYGCGAHGDVFDYLMRKENLNFKQALGQVRCYAN